MNLKFITYLTKFCLKGYAAREYFNKQLLILDEDREIDDE